MSGLDFQTVDIKFTKGLDTKVQQKLVIPGKWNQLNNLSPSADTTPRRRDGMTPLVAAQNGNGLALHGAELLTVAGSAVRSISTATTPASAAYVSGKLGFVGVAKNEIQRSTGMQDSCDMATGGGFSCYVWRDLNGAAVQQGLNCTLVDETTGTQLIANVVLRAGTTSFCPRVAYNNGAFWIFYIDGANLYGRIIVTTAPTVMGTETALVTAALAALNFDVCPLGTTLAVFYGSTDAVTSIRAADVTRAGTTPSVLFTANIHTQAALPIATLCAIGALTVDSTHASVFTTSTGATAMAGLAGASINSGYIVTAGPTQLDATTPAAAGSGHVTATVVGTNQFVFWDSAMAFRSTGFNPIKGQGVDVALATTSGPIAVANSSSFGGGATECAGPQGPFIAGKAFSSGLNIFLPVAVLENYQGLSALKASNNSQNTLFILDVTDVTTSISDTVVVATALYGGYGVAAINNNAVRISTPCSTPTLTAGGFGLACTERTLVLASGGFNLSPTGIVRLTFTPNVTVAPIKAQLGETTYFAGGSLTTYDGSGVSEAAFNLFPEGIVLELVGGGGAMTAGAHQVVVIAEWVDNSGQRHQSAPSLPVSMTVAANDRIRVRAPSLLLSHKTGINLVAYITQAAGTAFNRVASVAAGAAGTPNDPTQSTTTLALIDQADTVYATNQLLYNQPVTAGTTLPNRGPGPSSTIAVHQNRIFFDKPDQPGQWGYSQQYINNVGLQFNPDLSGSVDSTSGGIVGWCSMDEKLILFCARRPYVIYGQGADGSGGYSTYGQPQEVPCDVGCVDARSILKMPNGIIFKSQKGWYLLGRDLVGRYIGAGVEQYNANAVSSAVLLADRQECRFASPSGTQLIYSYEVTDPDLDGQWSTATMQGHDYLVADSIWWPTGGYYAHISLTDGLNRDTPNVFLDAVGAQASRAIITAGRTAFIHPGVLGGYQRVRQMYLTGTGTVPTSTLTVAVDFDDVYGGGAPGAYSFTVAYGTISFTGRTIDVRGKLRRQKCKSIAFTFTDTPLTADPAGVNFQALALEIGMKRGLNKLPGVQSVG